MARALLIVPHFWDPVCVPLGVSSLKAYAEQAGHEVRLYDFNTDFEVFGTQHAYFEAGKRQFPSWRRWNIERNGTETLALHQILYLHARHRPDYRELVAEVLNMDGRPLEQILDRLDVGAFDALFSDLYGRVETTLHRLLEQVRPDVVGCSLLNSTWPATLFLLERAKLSRPGIRTVVGGPGPLMGITSSVAEVRRFFDRHQFLDYFAIGEGEAGLRAILDDPGLPRQILGPGAVPQQRALTMDELPLPDYGELRVERYLQLSIASARGCPYECSFCAETVFWQGFRSVRRHSMLARLDELARRYDRTSFYICDSLSNHIVTPLTTDAAASGRGYALDCYLRADSICTDEDKVRRWRRGGLFRARLGMESGSQRILDAMVKKTTLDVMAAALRALAAEGIMTSTLWIVGYPGETEAEFQATLGFIRANRGSIYQSDAWLYQHHPEGLAHSRDIESERGSRHRFSADLNEIFAVTPYVVDDDLSPGERFDRLERFVAEMAALEVPNPYNLYEWLAAEGRWKALGHDAGWNVERSMMSLNA